MNETEFKANFIATFCATWCAINHREYCMRDNHESLENPPIEDAVFLADCAWEKWIEMNE